MGFDKLSPSGKFRTRNAILRIAALRHAAIPYGSNEVLAPMPITVAG
jgi:hypothetical protein